jgi:hypothetical protein
MSQIVIYPISRQFVQGLADAIDYDIRSIPKYYGADDTGEQDSTAFFQQCLDACSHVHIPAGHTYRIDSTIIMDLYQQITGDGWTSVLRAYYNDGPLIKIDTGCQLADFWIEGKPTGSGINSNSVGIWASGTITPDFPSLIQIDRVYIQRQDRAIEYDFGGTTTIQDCYIVGNNVGLRYTGTQVNDVNVFGGRIHGCNAGVRVDCNGAQNINFIGVDIEACNGTGIHVSSSGTVLNMNVHDCYFESNDQSTGSGFDIEILGTVLNMNVHDNYCYATSDSMSLNNVRNGIVEHNLFYNNENKTIVVGSSCSGLIIRDNIYNGSAVPFNMSTDVSTSAKLVQPYDTRNNRTYNVRDWGAVGDGTTDDTYAIQACIDAARIESDTVYFPPGYSYRITDSLHCNAESGTYSSVTLEGGGNGYDWAAAGVGGTKIVADFMDRPAIVIQGARSVTIKHMEIEGQNDAAYGLYAAGLSGYTKVETDWITSGCTYGQYNPYCAIAIDPYSTADPGGGSGYTSGTYSASNLSSRVVNLEDLTISQFVAGVAVKPCDDLNNCDPMRFDNLTIRWCTYGITVGNSQARGWDIYNPNIFGCMTCFEGLTHGQQQGCNPNIFGGQAFNCYQLFHVSVGFSAFSMRGFYCEAMRSMGYVGNSSSSQKHAGSFDGCSFKCQDNDGAQLISDDWLFMMTSGPVVFNGCSFANTKSVFNFIAPACSLDFHNCTFRGTDDSEFYIGRSFTDSYPFVHLDGCYGHNARYTLSTAGGEGQNGLNDVVRLTTLPNSRINCGANTKELRTYNKDYQISDKMNIFPYQLSSISSRTWTNNLMSAVASTSYSGVASEFAVGDKVFWYTSGDPLAFDAQYFVPALEVYDIVGTTVYMSGIFNDNLYDKTYNPSSLGIVYNDYVIPKGIYGDYIRNVAEVTNIVNPSGYFREGDFIRSAGLRDKTRIRGITESGLLLSKDAMSSQSGQMLYGAHYEHPDYPANTPQFWGASGDGVTDDSKAMRSLIMYAVATKPFPIHSDSFPVWNVRDMYIPEGDYRINEDGVFSTISYDFFGRQGGYCMWGAGDGSTRFVLDVGDGEAKWFYNNKQHPSWNRNTYHDMQFTSTANSGEIVDPYRFLANGFKLWANAATGGHETGFKFENCRFRYLNEVMRADGTTNTDSLTFSTCTISACNRLMVSNNPNQLTFNFIGSHAEGMYGDVLTIASGGTEYTADNGGGGGGFYFYGCSIITLSESGTQTYWVRVEDGADFYRNVVFNNCRAEMREDMSALVHWSGIELPTNSKISFVDCDLSIAQAAYTKEVEVVNIGPNKIVEFTRCFLSDNFTYTINSLNSASTLGRSNPGTIIFDSCMVPENITEKVTMANTMGRFIMRNCHTNTPSARDATDCDMGWEHSSFGDIASQPKIVCIKHDFGVWPVVGALERTVKLPVNAYIRRIYCSRPATGSSASPIQFFVGNDDKTTVYGSSVLAAESGEFSIDASPNVFLGSGVNDRTIRLWADPSGATSSATGGIAYIEYI